MPTPVILYRSVVRVAVATALLTYLEPLFRRWRALQIQAVAAVVGAIHPLLQVVTAALELSLSGTRIHSLRRHRPQAVRQSQSPVVIAFTVGPGQAQSLSEADMAHFAEIVGNVVQRVLVVSNDQEHRGAAFLADDLGLGGTWVQCSYNGTIRKQYPGIGYTYDPIADVFITPQPYPSWTLDSNHDWQAPTPMPQDGKLYTWDDGLLAWVEVEL